jgi:hypothetical protein
MDVTALSTALEWFHDRIEEALPRPVVISISIWFYKAAMLAWALWLSFAVVRWVRSAWDAFGRRLWQRTSGLVNPSAAGRRIRSRRLAVTRTRTLRSD